MSEKGLTLKEMEEKASCAVLTMVSETTSAANGLRRRSCNLPSQFSHSVSATKRWDDGEILLLYDLGQTAASLIFEFDEARNPGGFLSLGECENPSIVLLITRAYSFFLPVRPLKHTAGGTVEYLLGDDRPSYPSHPLH